MKMIKIKIKIKIKLYLIFGQRAYNHLPQFSHNGDDEVDENDADDVDDYGDNAEDKCDNNSDGDRVIYYLMLFIYYLSVREPIITCQNSHTMKMVRLTRMMAMMVTMMAIMPMTRVIIMVIVIEWLELKRGVPTFLRRDLLADSSEVKC